MMGGEQQATSTPAPAPVDTGAGAPAEPVVDPFDPSTIEDPTVLEAESDPADSSEGKSKGASESDSGGQDAGGDAGSQIAEELRLRAEDLGFTKEEIEAHGEDSQILERVVALAERKLGEMGRKPAPAAGDPPKPEAATEKPAEKAPPAAGGEFKTELSSDDFDPRLVSEVERIVKHYDGQIVSLKSELKEALDFVRGQQAEVQTREIDTQINSLGEVWHDVLGKGNKSDLDPKSEHFANRGKLIDEMNALALAHHQLGRRVPPMDRLMRTAANNLFGDRTREQVRKEIGNTLNKRRAQAIGRPSQRRSASVGDPRKSAIKAVQGILEKSGVETSEDLRKEFDSRED